jgi:polyferredoxin
VAAENFLSRSPLFRSRWPLFLARAATLAGFVFTILAGLFGSQVGSHNFAIIFVWIAWWTALKLLFIPLGGRSWCAVCPIPMPGEWISQGGIFPGARPGGARPGGARRIGLSLKWPARLGFFKPRQSGWLQAGGFLLIGLFSAVTLTIPSLTGWVLLGVFVLATVLALVFERRAFCNHLCPIGGFTGLYAQAAPVELRVQDRAVCAAHTEKTCYDSCPWGVYIASVQDNGPCGLCFECMRVCPHENVTFNLRAFGKDYLETRKFPRLDEAFLALVMLACALTFSAVFLGPWGWLRRAAYNVGSPEWLLYALAFLVFAGLVLPGLYALAVRLGGPAANFRQSLAQSSRPLLPLGLAAWVAFTISFAFAKISYVLPVISDPLGRGWDLFGTASIHFAPDVSLLSPLLQAAVLLGGLVWTGRVAARDQAPRRALAVQGFALLVTLSLMGLLIG